MYITHNTCDQINTVDFDTSFCQHLTRRSSSHRLSHLCDCLFYNLLTAVLCYNLLLREHNWRLKLIRCQYVQHGHFITYSNKLTRAILFCRLCNHSCSECLISSTYSPPIIQISQDLEPSCYEELNILMFSTSRHSLIQFSQDSSSSCSEELDIFNLKTSNHSDSSIQRSTFLS